MLRLLICDDAPDAREAVRSSLAEQSEIEVVAEAQNGEEAIALAASHEPNVILMDVKMPGLDGISATKRIRDLLPRTRIVAYAGSDDADDVMAMMEAGADAYCLKGAPLWELERAIAGASDPLARLAHAIARSVNGGGTAELVARELAELTGASFAATYLATADTSLSLAALSGPGAPESLHSAPGVVARSVRGTVPRARGHARAGRALPAGRCVRRGDRRAARRRRPPARSSARRAARERGGGGRSGAVRLGGRRPGLGRARQRAPPRADLRRGAPRRTHRAREQARLRRASGPAARPDEAGPGRLARPLRPRRVQAGQRQGGPCRRRRGPARGRPRLHARRPGRGRDLPRRRRGVRARRRGHRARGGPDRRAHALRTRAVAPGSPAADGLRGCRLRARACP